MTPFQTELINTYFTSMHFFRESDNTIQDAISVLGASIKKSKIKACSYHFALFKKNRRYAIFTDKIFYGQTIEGFIVSFNYTDITSVNNMSVVTKNRSYIFSKQISDQLLGIFLILNETTEGNTEKFDMFSVKSKRLQPIFGEILPCNFWGDIHDEIMRIPQYYPGPLAVLVLNSKLREVKKDSILIEITIKDKDLERYSYSDYEQAMEKCLSDEKVLKIYQNVFYKCICIRYHFENINFIFNGNIKHTFFKTAESALSKTIEIGDVIIDKGTQYKEHFLNNFEKQLNEQENASNLQNQTKQTETGVFQDELIKKHRRTDEELKDDITGLDKMPEDFQYEFQIPLSVAIKSAASEPGVYIIYCNGKIMKCGRAAYANGIHWRFTQYYNLNYDDRARKGDYWAVSPENRGDITVSWQCCPVSKCKELEYKLFEKYGKGPWGLRAPAKCDDDTWNLLI